MSVRKRLRKHDVNQRINNTVIELRIKLKEYRKLYGKDSIQVFKVIFKLKELTVFQEQVDEWIKYTLKYGSFGRCE
jgi:hypothetical protein